MGPPGHAPRLPRPDRKGKTFFYHSMQVLFGILLGKHELEFVEVIISDFYDRFFDHVLPQQ